jgi:hypothetical protein
MVGACGARPGRQAWDEMLQRCQLDGSEKPAVLLVKPKLQMPGSISPASKIPQRRPRTLRFVGAGMLWVLSKSTLSSAVTEGGWMGAIKLSSSHSWKNISWTKALPIPGVKPLIQDGRRSPCTLLRWNPEWPWSSGLHFRSQGHWESDPAQLLERNNKK